MEKLDLQREFKNSNQIMALIMISTLLIGCVGSVRDRKIPTSGNQPVSAQNALEMEKEPPPTQTQPQLDKYSKDQLEEMAAETGELDLQVLPEIQFWEEVTKNGQFAAFQTALKNAKTDEDRWRIVDKFPEIAERSGMKEALPARDSSKMIK